MRFAIETHELSKRFGKPGQLGRIPLLSARREGTVALDQVSLRVARGSIFCLVGPNGAGKTTLVKVLSTLILPDGGVARVNGYDLSEEQQIKGSIGLMTGDERSFYARLSGRENLRFYAGLHGMSASQARQRVGELSELLGLGDWLDKRFDTCSTGMKQRLGLARSLLSEPQLLFLDEPTRSLDPLAAARFRQALYALAHHQQRTVFLVTHDVDEAEELGERIGVMVQGRLRVLEEPQQLRELIRPERRCRLEVRGLGSEVVDHLASLDGVIDLSERETVAGLAQVELVLADRGRVLSAVMRAVAAQGGRMGDVAFEEPSWEEAFECLADTHCPDGEQPAIAVACDAPSLRDALDLALIAEDVKQIREGPGGAARRRRWCPAQGPLGWLRKPWLFLWRDVKTQMSYRFSLLLQVVSILFSSASFFFMAQLLGKTAAPYLNPYGGDYFSFLLVGIAFVGYQGAALYTFSGVVQSAQTRGTLEAMLTTPTRLSTILLSSSQWDFVLTSLRVAVYLLAGAVVFGADLGRANLLSGLVILALTMLTLSGMGILSASFILVFKRGSPINFLVGSLSSLLSGVYYPVEVLPDWLQRVASLFPLTYSLRAMRRAVLAGETLVELGSEVLILTAFAAALLPMSLVAFRYAVRYAKRAGSLTQF